MKTNLIIILLIIFNIYNTIFCSVKRRSHSRHKVTRIKQGKTSGNTNEDQNKKNLQVKTLPGFKNMELLNPNFFDHQKQNNNQSNSGQQQNHPTTLKDQMNSMYNTNLPNQAVAGSAYHNNLTQQNNFNNNQNNIPNQYNQPQYYQNQQNPQNQTTSSQQTYQDPNQSYQNTYINQQYEQPSPSVNNNNNNTIPIPAPQAITLYT
jgi:hypothetical protein